MRKNSILRRWTPHYHFLGAFHTHPYDSWKDVIANKGWNFSDADQRMILHYDDLWELSYPARPIAMVMAVTVMSQPKDSFAKADESKLVFNVGNLRFWLSAAVGEVLLSQEKVFSTDNILVNPYSRHYDPGGKLDGVD